MQFKTKLISVRMLQGLRSNDAEIPVNCIPVIVTLSCSLAEVGVKEVMMGPLKKVNPGRADTKWPFVTDISPEVPPPITVLMSVAETI